MSGPLWSRLRWVDRRRIGLGISSDSIRAVGVRGATVEWAIEGSVDADASLVNEVGILLSRIPTAYRARPRPRIAAAVGPSLVQTKRLSGLPVTNDADVVASLIREGASRFFMVGVQPVLTSGAMVDASGSVWAAAFDGRRVAAIEAACRDANLPLAAILPAVVVIPLAAGVDGSIEWRDGETWVEIQTERGAMRGLHRLPCLPATPAAHDAPASMQPVAPLAALGEQAIRFADAYGAAISDQERHPLSAPLQGDARDVTPVPRHRAVVAATLCAASLVAAAVAPGVAAERAGRAARAELGALRNARAELHEAERNLDLVSEALAEVAKARAQSVSPLAFLGRLTAVLPDESAIVTLRLDSLSGTVVALTPRAAVLVNRLDTIPSVVGPEIVGPVTRETVAARELERVTVRFALSPTERP